MTLRGMSVFNPAAVQPERANPVADLEQAARILEASDDGAAQRVAERLHQFLTGQVPDLLRALGLRMAPGKRSAVRSERKRARDDELRALAARLEGTRKAAAQQLADHAAQRGRIDDEAVAADYDRHLAEFRDLVTTSQKNIARILRPSS